VLGQWESASSEGQVYDASLFRPLTKEVDREELAGPSLTFWQEVWRRLSRNPVALASLGFLILVVAYALLVPALSPYRDVNLDLANARLTPSWDHPFGTDTFGRDLFFRVAQGARISLFIAFAATTIDLLIGVFLGALAGLRGGVTDSVVMRTIEVLSGVPWLIMVILLMLYLGSGLFTMIVAMAITGWTTMARLVRGQVLALKNQEFVFAARALGASTWRILWRHLFPNVLGIVVVRLTMNIPAVIFTEAALSFIGLGLQPPLASWGVLVNDGWRVLEILPWTFFFPALAITLTSLAFNLLGDALRDAIDPRLRV